MAKPNIPLMKAIRNEIANDIKPLITALLAVFRYTTCPYFISKIAPKLTKRRKTLRIAVTILVLKIVE